LFEYRRYAKVSENQQRSEDLKDIYVQKAAIVLYMAMQGKIIYHTHSQSFAEAARFDGKPNSHLTLSSSVLV